MHNRVCMYFVLLEYLRAMFNVTYSEKGSIHRPAEEQAYIIFFVDFLDECKGQ